MSTNDILSNSETAIAALDKRLRAFGKQSVAIGRPLFGLELMKAAGAGIINEDDADARYGAYYAGRSDFQKNNALAAEAGDEGSRPAQVSKCRQIIKLGNLLSDQAEIFADNITSRGKMLRGAGEKVESTFDALVKVARAQLKQPANPLTQEEIDQLLVKPAPATKDEVAKLVAAYKSTRKLCDDALANNSPAAPGLEQSIEGLAAAIVAAGGEVPMTKDEEKAALMAFKQQRGYARPILMLPAR